MKKVIITIALVLIALIPTYVLVFQAMRTAVPDATLGDADIAPAFVRWSLQGKNSEVSQTSTDEDRANKRFGKAEPIRLESLADAASIRWEIAPKQVRIAIYNLTENNTYVGTVTPEELLTHPLVGTSDRLQVIVVADWTFTKVVSARAAYSFEVNG